MMNFKTKGDITQEQLKHLLHYCKDSGLFTWKVRTSNRIKIGSIAGSVNIQGYTQLKVAGKVYLAHRLVWLYMYGRFPKEQIDHINRCKRDNRLCNIREVSCSENMQNTSRYTSNTSGVTGVRHNQGNRWIASIGVEGKVISLGSFVEFHEAVNARKNAELFYGFHENHGK